MKNLLSLFSLALLCIFFFSNCKNEGGQKAAGADASAYAGYWANKAWWEVLNSAKSPRKASERAGISSFFIYQDSGKWVADLYYNWHEGSQFSIAADGSSFTMTDKFDETGGLKYSMMPQPDGSLQVDSFLFVKIGDKENQFREISAAVLGGSYQLKGSDKIVNFNTDGTVTGLDDYTHYDLQLDYIVEETGSDELMLDKGANNPEFYAFKFENGQLTISFIETDTSNSEYPQYVVGKPKYELVKK